MRLRMHTALLLAIAVAIALRPTSLPNSVDSDLVHCTASSARSVATGVFWKGQALTHSGWPSSLFIGYRVLRRAPTSLHSHRTTAHIGRGPQGSPLGRHVDVVEARLLHGPVGFWPRIHAPPS